jgi:hypothetical protein
MNNKDIKSKIKETAIHEIPDVFNKIDLQSIQIEEEKTIRQAPKVSFRLKLVMTSFLLLLTVFFSYQLLRQENELDPFSTDQELLAFQTVSASTIIEHSDLDELSLELSSQASDVSDYFDELNVVFELSELMVNQRDDIQYDVLESDRSEFEYHIRFRAKNLNDEWVEYHIYYNQSNHIQGIFTNDDTTYQFIKDDQVMRLYKDDDHFVEVSEEEIDNQKLYNFSYMKNQQVQFSTKIRMFVEDGLNSAKVEYMNQAGLEIALEMRRNNGSMDVEYDVIDQQKQMKGNFNMAVEKDNMGRPFYHFRFDDESETENERPGRNPGMGPRFSVL